LRLISLLILIKNMTIFIANKCLKLSGKALFLSLFLFKFSHAVPLVEQWAHPSGARIAWIHSPSLPMLDVRLEFDGGSRRDPAEHLGLAQATALMSQRGMAAHDPHPALDENQVTERWMDWGAQWSVGANSDRFSATLRTLTTPEVLHPVIDFAAAALAHPDWSSATQQAVWLREQARFAAAWRNAQTQPATLAQRRFNQAVYGTHPYGQEATPESWQRITLSDMQHHWHTHIRPCHARITLVGAVTRDQVDALVTRLLAPLQQQHADQATCPTLPTVAEVPALTQAEAVRVPLATAQAHVLLGQPGYRRDDPDFFPLLLGNYILGAGGFVSRLTTDIREKRGLSYGVYSSFMPGMHAGAFVVGLQTRPDQAAQALALAQQVVAEFVQTGPSDAELQAAQTYMTHSFALRIDSNRKLLDNAAQVLWFGLPSDYLRTWTQRMQAVTATDIRRAFARVLQPQRMVSVVVGDKSE
jgi:zinc protease